jgi:competence protein ComEA
LNLTRTQQIFVGACITAILLAVGVGLYGRARPEAPSPQHLYTPPQAPPVPTTITVYVAGAVASPGLKTLPGGSRVNDALVAAGGVTADADTAQVNPAALIEDGQRIDVPVRTPPSPSSPPTPEPSQPAQPKRPAHPININAATAEELQSLPDIGPVLAQQIVEYRRQVGGFRRIDDLGSVPGIGPKRLAAIRPFLVLQ